MLDKEFSEKIRELGKMWKVSKDNRVVSNKIKSAWEDLIEKWISDKSLPLIVRKEADRKGCAVRHASGREVVFADNSFAVWVYANALDGKIFTLEEIKNKLKNDEIPMAFVLTSKMKKAAKYKKTLGNIFSGWKLCHIESVGFNTKRKVEDLDIEEIESHFRKYANTKNMFALPKEIGALGEIQEFIDAQRSL